MNFATTTSLNFGSGRISRLRTNFLRPIYNPYLILRNYYLRLELRAAAAAPRGFLRAVFGAALFTISDALSIERSANSMITNTRKIFHTASADQNDRVLLKIVADARNVGSDFVTIRQTNTANFTKSRIRLLRSRGVNAGANAAALRAALKSRRLGLPELIRRPLRMSWLIVGMNYNSFQMTSQKA